MKENSLVFKPVSNGRISRHSATHILLLLTLFVAGGCAKRQQAHAKSQPELPAVQVRAQAVESKKIPATEEVVGTVQSRLRATVEAKTMGRIIELPVVLGQKVRAGELLARLDAPEIKARLQQAEANLQLAEREWKRVSSLFEQQASTRSEYESAESRRNVAIAAVAEARAMLGYVEIRAPFDGVVTKKWADIGDLAAPGKPLLDIQDPSKLQVEADLPEAIASSIQPNARMTIRMGQSSNELAGTVAEIAPIADPVSRTFRVKLDVPGTPGLMAGQFARLLVPLAETASVRVPASAIVQRGQMEMVFAVENQRANLRLVKTGRQVGDETEILSGLEPGEIVVTEAPQQLVDGQPVQGN